MRLFQTNQSLTPESKTSLTLNTPLGDCLYEFYFQGEDMPPPSFLERTDKEILLTTWDQLSYRMECLKMPFQPVLSSDMYVDECWALIWRVLVKKKASINWKCSLAVPLEGSCETGENLVSCIFEDKDISLSIGTEDEEKIAYRAEKKLWMPGHLQGHITEKNIVCLRNGLEIYFDQLLPGDGIQTHFLIAWSSTEKRAISTWTAVEQSYTVLLQQSGFF